MNKRRQILYVGLFFSVLTLLLFSPQIIHLESVFFGSPELIPDDIYNFAWKLWWFHKALMDLGQSPFVTNYIQHPMGRTLYATQTTLFNTLLSVPLQTVTTLEGAYNLLLMAQFVIAGVGMYLLADYVLDDQWAAILAAFIFAFSPFHLAQALARLNLSSIQWIPFYILFVVKVHRKPTIFRSICVVVFLSLCTLSSWYYLLFGLLFIGFFVVYQVLSNGFHYLQTNSFFVLFLSHLYTGILLIPLAAPMIAEIAGGKIWAPYELLSHNTDLMGFIIPSSSTNIGQYFRPWNEYCCNQGPIQNTYFLGWTSILLFLLGILRSRVRKFWVYCFIFFWVLSLGPELQIMNYKTGIPLPYALKDYFNLFQSMRIPSRITAYTMVPFALIAGAGFSRLKNKTSNIYSQFESKNMHVVMLTLFLALLVVEYMIFPYPTFDPKTPEFYKQLKNTEKKTAVLPVPPQDDFMAGGYPSKKRKVIFGIPDYQEEFMYYATVHERPIVGGLINRFDKNYINFLSKNRILANLVLTLFQSENMERLLPITEQHLDTLKYSSIENLLRKHEIQYVVLHNDRYKHFLSNKTKLKRVHDSANLTVYALPEQYAFTAQ